VLVFVEATWATRLERLAERGVGADEAAAADAHPNEAELDAVRDRADIHVENNETVQDAVESVVTALHGLGVAVDSR
jgi:dephospho-CoA kinase